MQFKLNMDANLNGTSYQGFVRLTHSDIVAAFGQGDDCCDKTTQEWVFESDTGEVFSLYDWKEQTTPQHEYEWHIGAEEHRNVDRFKNWLLETIRKAA